MKRTLAAAAALLLMPVLALAQITITADAQTHGDNQIILFTAQNVPMEEEISEQEQLEQELRLMMISGAIGMRLNQARAQELFDQAKAGGSASLHQTAYAYADESVASLAIVWEGVQPDRQKGCVPYTLNIDLNTGMEIAFDQLFADPAGAIAAMETVIERDYLENMNTYVEAAELLPMPTDCFSFDETGLTVYYDDSRYRTLDGRSGYVTFYWHEIGGFIGEDSPAYALSRPQATNAEAIRAANGYFGEHRLLGVYEPLGKAMAAYGLTDEPDYTPTTVYYPLGDPQLRGMAVEIAKYAQTTVEETPICAVRHSRVSFNGLTTGTTAREGIIALLGEPEQTRVYDENDAYDMMLCPGESLIYFCDEIVIELHLDEAGVLDTIILRDAMPETLY